MNSRSFLGAGRSLSFTSITNRELGCVKSRLHLVQTNNILDCGRTRGRIADRDHSRLAHAASPISNNLGGDVNSKIGSYRG